MCDHQNRGKFFCLRQACSVSQVYGCTYCLQSHSHGESISEKQLLDSLKKYSLPSTFKQSRKQIVLKLYNFLNMVKNQFYDHIDVYLNNILSQIKYSYLFHEDILEAYRLIRDQKYHKITHQQLAHYYKKTNQYTKIQIDSQQEKIYNQYIKELNNNIGILENKITQAEQLFHFKISKNCLSLKEKLIASLQSLSSGGRSKRSSQSPRSPRKGKNVQDFDKPYFINKSNDSPISPKKTKVVQQADKPYFNTFFLTPIKASNDKFLDYSIQRSKSPSLILLDDKSINKSENIIPIPSSQLTANSNKLPQTHLRQKLIETQKKSFFPSKNQVSTLSQSKTKTKTKQSSQYLYETVNSQNIFIKVHTQNDKPSQERQKEKEASSVVLKTNNKIEDIKNTTKSYNEPTFSNSNSKMLNNKLDTHDQPFLSNNISKESSIQKFRNNNNLTTNQSSGVKPPKEDLEIKVQKIDYSQPSKPQKSSIKERQQNVRNRLNSLLNQNNRIDETIRQINEHHKVLQKGQKKKTQTEQISIQIKKEKEVIKQKLVQTSNRNENYLTINDKLKQSSKAPSRFMERKTNQRQKAEQLNSLAKEIFEYSRQPKTQLINKSILKEIPYQEKRKNSKNDDEEVQNTPKKTWQIVRDEQLQQGAIFAAGINQPNIQNKIFFLERYLKTYKNNLTAIQYLSFLYLEANNFKECLNLTNHHLDRVNMRMLENKHKFNLVVNKTAALNNLGRYSETIKVLESFKLYENEKIHKNLGDAYFNIGTYDKSIYHYQKAVNLNPKFDQAFYNLAVALFIQDNFEYAKINIQKGLFLNPKNSVYKQLSNHIQQKMSNNVNQ